MKFKKLLLPLFLVLLVGFHASPASAQLFKSDKEKWKRLFIELKKINVRIQNLATDEIKPIKNTQANLQSQLDEIKNLIPALQGVIEKNDSNVNDKFRKIDKLTVDLENKVVFELQENNKTQKEMTDSLQKNFQALSSQLKEGLAKDAESLSKSNDEAFRKLYAANAESLNKMVDALNAQSNTLGDTQAYFKNDLGPALAEQSEKDRKALKDQMQALIAQLNAGAAKNLDALNANNAAVVASLDGKYKAMVDVLSKSVAETGKAQRNLEKILQTDRQEGRDNLAKLAGSLQDIKSKAAQNQASLNAADASLIQVRDQNSQVLDKFAALINLNKDLAAHYAEMERHLDQTAQTMTSGQENVKLNHEKLTRMIDMFQQTAKSTLAVGEKMERSLQKLDALKASDDLADEKRLRMIDSLQTVVTNSVRLDQKIDQSFQRLEPKIEQAGLAGDKMSKLIEILKAIAQEQTGMQDSLADLRRKANVNISRNDDIKKELGKIQKPGGAGQAPGGK